MQRVNDGAIPTRVDGDVLRPVDLVTHGSGHRNALDRHLPELLTVVGTIDGQGPVDGSLHEEVAGRCQSSPVARIG